MNFKLFIFYLYCNIDTFLVSFLKTLKFQGSLKKIRYFGMCTVFSAFLKDELFINYIYIYSYEAKYNASTNIK